MVTEPKSMDELVYFTRRNIKEGSVMAWVYRGDCPKCKKGKMGKPRDGKTGKVKTRATEYECPACHYTVPKDEYEDTLECEVSYTCPHCGKKGEAAIPFNRKKVRVFDEEKQKKVSVDAIRFTCAHCKESIDIVKKMKQ